MGWQKREREEVRTKKRGRQIIAVVAAAAAAEKKKKKCALNSTKQWTAKYRSPKEREREDN